MNPPTTTPGAPLRCVVLDDYQRVATAFADWSVLDGVTVDQVDRHLDGAALVERIGDAQIVVAMRERTAFPADVFPSLPNLRLLITTGMSNAVIDVAAASAHGVVVCGTSGAITPTSEHTWGLIHALARHIVTDDSQLRAGGWQTRVGIGLHGKRLGVIGLGRLGGLVAKVGLAFGMDVVAWSQNLTEERCAQVGVNLVDRDTLLGTADVITIHLVLSDRTRHLIGANELAMMKPSTLLINTSRGPIVDTAALITALNAGTIAGAGLDVFETEPLAADDALRRTANTVLTPHTGYVTDDCYRIFFTHIVENIAAWQAGEPIRVIGL
ncbi:MAG TPA: D-2-hydroxyacid dehydrogenase family protein [Ilumatobacteraceae bacterium]|nr:D-2-hydroxyacid dehydrogenase family protein [Ilumatobacteraceae bacterium]